jgi:hypothetical protein
VLCRGKAAGKLVKRLEKGEKIVLGVEFFAELFSALLSEFSSERLFNWDLSND